MPPDFPSPDVPPPVDVYVCGSEVVSRVAANTGDVTKVNLPGGDPPPAAVAVDRHGNVFLGSVKGTVSGILKVPVGGGAPQQLAPHFIAFSVATDWAGNVYAVGDRGVQQYEAIRIPSDGGPTSVIWSGPEYAVSIAVDGFRNAYILFGAPVAVVKIPVGGGQVDLSTLLTGLFQPGVVESCAVDPWGKHLYITNFDTVLKVPLNGSQHTSIGTGLSAANDVAVDAAENVYISDVFNDSVVVVRSDTGSQLPVCHTRHPVAVAVAPTRAIQQTLTNLIGRVFGAAAVDGYGWIVIGNHFIPIPPHSPVLWSLMRAAARYMGGAIENAELARQLRNLGNAKDVASQVEHGPDLDSPAAESQ